MCNNNKLDSKHTNLQFIHYQLMEPPKLITKTRLLIGMVGVQMARHWHIVQNKNGNFDIYTIPVDGGEEKKIDNI
jgi:hypothetical protein